MGFCFLVSASSCRTFMMFGAMCLLLSTDPLALHSGQKNKEKVSATLINESEIIVKRLSSLCSNSIFVKSLF